MGLMSDYVEQPNPLLIERHIESLSLESNFVSNMVSSFKHALPSFILKLKEDNSVIANFLNNKTNTEIELSKQEKQILEILKSVDYLNFAECVVSVPENFKGHLLDYCELLNQITIDVGNVQNTILKEYNILLSTFLTNKEDKISLKDHSAFYRRVDQDREEMLGRIKKYFPTITGNTKVKLKDVLPRGNDYSKLIHESVKLKQSHGKTNLLQIQARVQECIDLLDMILSGIDKGTIEVVGPNAALNISKGAYTIARYIELVTLVYFDNDVYLNTVSKLNDSILKFK